LQLQKDAILTGSTTLHRPLSPSNHKWFRNLAVSQIIADTMDEMGLKLPPTHVDIADIRRKYHAAERKEQNVEGKSASNKSARNKSAGKK
jgi:hypothetical protein